ncbi:MAG: NAD-dependent epimerase/dehydratase family protein, partial [Microcystaceae cyanobacterium]
IWGGESESVEINVVKTIELINLLNSEVCQQIIYFSTASILDRNNQLLPQANQLGTDYIRTKYECYSRLSQSAIASKITVLFPTLVLGGDRHKPYSHLSAGLPEVLKWIDLIRWFKADGSFHFIHAQDIAQIVQYLVAYPPARRVKETEENAISLFVLGNPSLTVNQAIKEICAYLKKRIYIRIPLSIWLANFLIQIFRIQMDSWSRFSLDYRHFTHRNPVTPATFGLTNYCSTLADVLKMSGINPK